MSVFLVLATLLSRPAGSQEALRVPMVQVEKYSIEQGLSDRSITYITKDRRGFLWIATSNGLNRFDGYDFLNYDSRPRNRHKIAQTQLYAVLPDRAGNLLIGYNDPSRGSIDLLDPETGQLRPFEFDSTGGFQGHCRAFFRAPDGAVFFHTLQNGRVSIYQFDEKSFRFLKVFEAVHPGVDQNCFVGFLRASDGTFWFAYNWEFRDPLVIHAAADGRTLRLYEKGNFDLGAASGYGRIMLTEAADGKILFTLYPQGVFVIDGSDATVFYRHPQLPQQGYYFAKDKAGNLLAYQNQPADPAKGCYLLSADGQQADYSWMFGHQAMITQVYSDDFTKGLFAGSGNGFNNYRLRPDRFQTFLAKDLGNAPYGMSMRGIAKVGRNKIFFASELYGLWELDLNTNAVSRPGDRSPQLAPLNELKYPRNMLAQGDSILWISCVGAVLKYDLIKGTLDFFKTKQGQDNSGAAEVWGISFGKDGNLWVVPRDARLLKMSPATGNFSVYLDKEGNAPLKAQPSFILCSRDGTIWVGTTVAGLFRIKTESGETRQYTANPGDPAGFNSNHISCIHEDEAGLLWVGTMEGGLHVFDPARGLVTAIYSRENGLRNNSVVGILPDDKGNYWVSTFNGLSYFDTQLKTFRNYTTADGLSHNEFNRYSYFFDKDAGRFYFGGMNGVNAFDQNNPQASANDAPLLISKMSATGNDDRINDRYEGINDGTTITLAPGSRFLHLRLALGNYYDPAGNQFSYKIEGLDKDWNYLGANRDLRIDRLPAGSYTLRLRGADNSGNWSSRELTLHLVVQQFWYKRWWAYLLYTAVIVAAAYYFYRFQLGRQIAEKEAERLHQLDAFKSRFFTNISHEFRTPLTVILGMVASLKKYFDQDSREEHDRAAEMIDRNSRQLLNLVNQLLDLSRLESGKLQLSPANGDIIAFLHYQLQSFESYAETRNIALRFHSALPQLEMAFDHEKIQTILVNLISNAIKFTPEGGQIDVQLQTEQQNDQRLPSRLVIRVIDSGIGIPADQLGRIFDRFYQVDDSTTRKVEGTGIGLAMVQELVKFMQGSITVESTPEQGTTFVVTLPYSLPLQHTDSAHSESAGLISDARQAGWAGGQFMPATNGERQDEEADGQLPLLLLAEDNPDVRFYIAGCVKPAYRVLLAGNGAEGIETARERVPDIIISDVMMPEKDGFDLCETLKSDERTSHIPIILLTARADFESRIAGLKRGADDYLAKPFEPAELLVRLENLIRIRRQLQQRYAGLSLPAAVSDDPALVLEDAFLLKVRDVVVDNLSDADFEMPQLERALGMSRSQVFRKVKALTGASPSVLIRTIRLNKAKDLLRNSTLTIAEVAYEVGFSTPAYFSTMFLEAFGKSPSEWRQT